MGVELRPILKGMESPSNPKVAVVAMGAGLRATAKAVESPPDPCHDSDSAPGGNTERDWTEVSRGRSSQTLTVMGETG